MALNDDTYGQGHLLKPFIIGEILTNISNNTENETEKLLIEDISEYVENKSTQLSNDVPFKLDIYETLNIEESTLEFDIPKDSNLENDVLNIISKIENLIQKEIPKEIENNMTIGNNQSKDNQNNNNYNQNNGNNNSHNQSNNNNNNNYNQSNNNNNNNMNINRPVTRTLPNSPTKRDQLRPPHKTVKTEENERYERKPLVNKSNSSNNIGNSSSNNNNKGYNFKDDVMHGICSSIITGRTHKNVVINKNKQSTQKNETVPKGKRKRKVFYGLNKSSQNSDEDEKKKEEEGEQEEQEEEKDEEEEEEEENKKDEFMTGKQKYIIEQKEKGKTPYKSRNNSREMNNSSGGGNGRNPPRRQQPFKSPTIEDDNNGSNKRAKGGSNGRKNSGGKNETKGSGDSTLEQLLESEEGQKCDPKMLEMILNEIMDRGKRITWNDIAGLESAKKCIQEIVIWPMKRPDLFSGLRAPPKGILLFGPPGTGKTMIGKAIACEAEATFFNISPSVLTSKWVGEGEKMVRTLFVVARFMQPSVIFIDEIDSLLSQRGGDSEVESSRRMKNEFLVQLDGCGVSSEERILLVGATNRPSELDEAARRRLTKRLYIPLPDPVSRRALLNNLLRGQEHDISEEDLTKIVEKTDGYSGSDITAVTKEAAMYPFRDVTDILNVSKENVRPMMYQDFEKALQQVTSTVAVEELEGSISWEKKFGTTL
eukprot:TRINITY_DN2937_c0_g1_i1.p1 TRINITY_DN2937_c0_g1~~TRINITY_DN2937_c0_g1_i1.p1  ORF type:complete len:725 (-),score=256.78 TRINITY_DN2937_c0_g1_i1:84-2207(-)